MFKLQTFFKTSIQNGGDAKTMLSLFVLIIEKENNKNYFFGKLSSRKFLLGKMWKFCLFMINRYFIITQSYYMNLCHNFIVCFHQHMHL